jgi:Mn-dependent DtxR family transcriptional regulator
MPIKPHNLALTNSQAACLIALRHGNATKPSLAIAAKLDLTKTATALELLARLGLAKQNQTKRWHATARGKICRYNAVPDRLRCCRDVPGIGGLRLLALLDRPMRGGEIAEKLGITRQRVRQLIVKLHAQGYVRLGDRENIFWMVMRAGDKTCLLSRDEERVLSAIPRDYVTDITKIRLATGMQANKVMSIIEKLNISRLVETSNGLRGDQVYRITTAGLNHPQRARSARLAQELRLPVESDRINKVLSTISDSSALRIKDLSEMLQIPHQSTNALMQYLKRKHLVEKICQDLHAPYALTEMGRAALVEMTRRQAA